MSFYDSDGVRRSSLAFTEQDRIRVFDETDGHGASWHLSSFADFDLATLKSGHVKHALIDLDGCLVPAYCHDELTDEVVAAVETMRSGLETVSLATNNEVDLTALNQRLELDHVFQPYQEGSMLPYKPDEAYYRHILATLAVPPESVVMIGDNPIHDVWGASQLGMRTMLVDRIDPYGFFDMDE